jgi:hypothetical protein
MLLFIFELIKRKASNGGADRAALIHSGLAEPMMMRNGRSPLQFNEFAQQDEAVERSASAPRTDS